VHPVKAIGANGLRTVEMAPVFRRQSLNCDEFPAATALCTGPTLLPAASATAATVNQAVRDNLGRVAH
jgi:hypothetical protein